MGWTGQSLRSGETVRDIIIRSYQGDPAACASCGWHESAHPRIAGSEYAAIYGPRADQPEPHAFAPSVPRYRVLDYAMVALSEVYMAVETIETGAVWAGVCLVRMSRGEVTYKDMSEDMGPGAVRCPKRILDRLTDTSSDDANEWRAACRARLEERSARPTISAGTRVRFAEPLTFSNGDQRDLFELIKGSTFRAVDPDGYVWSQRYTISSWRERPYSVA
ncbi:MAG: hypothetical protein ABIV25_04700 [Paracoccaceae bacterium]